MRADFWAAGKVTKKKYGSAFFVRELYFLVTFCVCESNKYSKYEYFIEFKDGKAIKPLKGMPDFFHKIAPAIKNGTATTKEMSTAQGVLTRSINKLGKQGSDSYNNLSKANKKLVDNMTEQRKQIGFVAQELEEEQGYEEE